MTWDEIEAHFVRAAPFGQSPIRAELWHQLQAHLALVTTVVGTVSRIWLAGSFISSKPDPSDIDLCYLIPPDALNSIADDQESIDYLDNLGTREWCVKHDMRIDAYMLRLPTTSDVQALGVTGAMAPGDHEVFKKLGLYDEIWQHCRTGDSTERRGYVEVSL